MLRLVLGDVAGNTQTTDTLVTLDFTPPGLVNPVFSPLVAKRDCLNCFSFSVDEVENEAERVLDVWHESCDFDAKCLQNSNGENGDNSGGGYGGGLWWWL